MSGLRHMLRRWVPPVLVEAASRMLPPGIRFSGDYSDWISARHASSGYDSDVVLERMRDASSRVKRGDAVFERDSVLFERIQYSFPLMAGLLRLACDNNGRLSVLDFGGGFGSSFKEFSSFWPKTNELRWNIVEQSHIAECGRREFGTEQLHFYESIDACLREERPDVILLSSVLQYLETPYALIEQIKAKPFRHVIVDRTPCSQLDRDVLTVQEVPPSIYLGSYPCWIFSRARLLSAFLDKYMLLADSCEQNTTWRTDRFKFTLDGFLLDLPD